MADCLQTLTWGARASSTREDYPRMVTILLYVATAFQPHSNAALMPLQPMLDFEHCTDESEQ